MVSFPIALRKLAGDNASVDYAFGCADDQMGVLRIRKADGAVTQIEPVPGDEREYQFSAAADYVRHFWEKGEYPHNAGFTS